MKYLDYRIFSRKIMYDASSVVGYFQDKASFKDLYYTEVQSPPWPVGESEHCGCSS